jgi:hypothetical protein
MRSQPSQSQRRHLARDDDDVKYVRQISQQPIEHGMHPSLLAQVVIVVQHQDELLLDSVQHFVQENIHGALRMLRQLAGSFLEV